MMQPLTLFDDLTPHGYCLLWEPGLIWMHLIADGAIAIAYLSIPAALAVIGNRRPDLNPMGILYLFAAFIILCAVTHVFGMLTIWLPVYSLQAGAKTATALVSVATSVLVWRMLDTILNSPTQGKLQAALDDLGTANAELERRVEERTRELSHANDQLFSAAEESRQAEQAKAQFLQRMSHELRTPLNAIIGFSELLDMQLAGPINATQRSYCQSILTASSQLLDQINDILDLERLEQHGPEFHPEAVYVDSLIGDVCSMLKPISEERGVRIAVDNADHRPFRTDRRSMRTIVINLMSNAIKYSPRGGDVEVTLRPVGADLSIEVRDHGIGIPEDKLGNVFEPFFRGHERDLPSVGGSGLGLTLVKQLMDALHGRIEISSTVAGGTTVRVIIPEMAEHSLPEASVC